ncbi:hypothetical protein GCM10007874_66370 [Labrys miyagiensis]|uniref:Oxalurate catabolism protein HpxZ n=1 Tax=Labrys miyagiensis TaxID=346912 RepID=A0ABQ6CZE1_9HYPH|nr:hypothetical protein GCM10007874_66370 [Labrys miyagiensis]
MSSKQAARQVKAEDAIAINQPGVLAEVTAIFERYEEALVTNDVAVLDQLFWQDGRTIRYGIAENLYGFDEIAAFRANRPSQGLVRELQKTVITTYGRDFATASTLFVRPDIPGRCGRQMQTWLRTPEGWRVVAAHVSVIAMG